MCPVSLNISNDITISSSLHSSNNMLPQCYTPIYVELMTTSFNTLAHLFRLRRNVLTILVCHALPQCMGIFYVI